MPSTSLFWHDYETFGTHPAVDRPVQFAGLRTTLDLEAVGEPLVIGGGQRDRVLVVFRVAAVHADLRRQGLSC